MRKSSLKHMILGDCHKAMRLAVVFHILCTCLIGVLSVSSAGILGDFADAVLNMDMAYGMQNAAKLSVCILLTVVFIPILELFGNRIMLKNALRHDRMVLGRFLDKRYLDVKKLDAGDIQHRLEWDPCDLRIYWVNVIVNFCMVFVTTAFLGYAVRDIYWGFTVCAASLMLIKICVPAALKKIQAKYDRKTREYQTSIRAGEAEITEKPHAIRLLGLTEPLLGRLDQQYRIYYKNIFKKSVVCSAIADTAASGLDTFCILIILFIGAVMVSRSRVLAGQVAAMAGYFGVLNHIIKNISYCLTKIPVLNNLAGRMEVLYSDAEAGGEAITAPFRGLGLKDISFTYDGHTVCKNLTFDVKKQEKVAICGANGSGKSTLAKIICGLYSEYEGCFLMNGRDAEKTDIRDRRRQFAYAVQDPYLFCGTLKDNVRLGNPRAAEGEVVRIMDEMGIGALTDKTVSMDQNDLSGGEKQKVSIARALLKDAPILVLDEPESSLDTKSVDKLLHFIRTTEKTVILITHDKRLLKAVDRVIEL